MHRLLRPSLVATALMLSVACSPRPDTEGGELERVRNQQELFFQALSARDLPAVIAYFAEDAALFIPDMPVLEGRRGIADLYQNLFRSLERSDYAPGMLRMSSSADMAYGAGLVTNVFQGQQGPQEYSGKYLIIWERRDGDWVVTLYSTSEN